MRLMRIAGAVSLSVLLAATALAADSDGTSPGGSGQAPAGSPVLFTTNVPQRAAALLAGNPRFTDLSESYFGSDDLSIHLHIMAAGQFCPLHCHTDGYELAVIVSGSGLLEYPTGKAGGAESNRTSSLSAGDAVLAPPGRGHKLSNARGSAPLATLVFSAPPFCGNLYLDPMNPRPATGAEPLVLAARDSRGAGEGGTTKRPLPFPKGLSLERLDMRRAELLTLGAPTAFYTVAGSGFLSVPGAGRLSLLPGLLVGIRAGTQASFQPGPGAPLTVYAIGFR